MRRLLIVAALFAVASAVTQAQTPAPSPAPIPSPTPAESALAKVNANFAAAVNGKDASSIGALYTEDAVLLPPNGEMVRGRTAIASFWKGLIEQGLGDVSVASVESSRSAGLGYDVGNYELSIKPASGPVVRDKGKYLTVLKRDPQGQWRISHDIWNSSLPIAPAK